MIRLALILTCAALTGGATVDADALAAINAIHDMLQAKLGAA